MKGSYYKLPLNFEGLKQKVDLVQVPLDTSICEHIFMIATTAIGECKFDLTYGSKLWELDFDLLKRNNELKQFITEALSVAIFQHEKRFLLQDIEITINQHNLGNKKNARVKRKVAFFIRGLIKETNRELVYNSSFFVGPLSY